MRTFVVPRLLTVFAIGGLILGGVVTTSRAQDLTWHRFPEAMAVADTTNRFVMVSVYAPWCGWCRKMKTDVYPSAGVRRCLSDAFVLARLNRDDKATTYRYQGRRYTPRELASQFRADEVPTTVLLSPEGKYLVHLSGFVRSAALRPVLAYVATGAYRSMSFSDFRSDPLPCRARSTESGRGNS